MRARVRHEPRHDPRQFAPERPQVEQLPAIRQVGDDRAQRRPARPRLVAFARVEDEEGAVVEAGRPVKLLVR
jgi:hypothetical protein